MNAVTRMPDGTTRRPPVASLRHLAIITLIVVLAMQLSTTTAHADVGLGTADSFAVLAGSAITFATPAATTITGDIGIHPGLAASVTGYDDIDHTGEAHFGDAVAQQAKADLVTAYNDAAGRPATDSLAAGLGGQTLVGGVYDELAGTFEITGTLTLDGEGDPDSVWVFQASSTLITASNSNINLINGADACNVFWQVGTSATLGTNSDFVGTIMAMDSITLTTGATVEGRVLARTAAVTMDSNTITNAACTSTSNGNGNGNGASSSSSTNAVRLVKFWYDGAGTRVSSPAGDWTVTLDTAVVDAEQSSAWAQLSGANYSVQEQGTPTGWEEVACSTVTLPDIGTAYLDATGTGDFRFPSDVDEGAHAVCNQTALIAPPGSTPAETPEPGSTPASGEAPTQITTPTRVDTGGGGTAAPSGQLVVLLLAIAGAGVLLTQLRHLRDSG